MADVEQRLVDVENGVDLRCVQTQDHKGRVEDEEHGEEGDLLLGVVGREVGGQEGEPQEEGREHKEEDQLRLVEVVR